MPTPYHSSQNQASSTLKPLKQLWPYLWSIQPIGMKIRFVIAALCLIISKVATLLIPQFYKEAVNILTPSISGYVLVPTFMIIGYGVARLLSTLFAELRDAIFAHVTQETVRKAGLDVFEHLHNLSLRYHLDRQTGGLTRSIERGTKGIESLLQFLTFNIVPTLFEIILVSGILWWIYGFLFAALTFLTMLLYVSFTIGVTNWRINYVRAMNQTDNQASGRATDSLLNYETVKYFNNEDHEAEHYNHALISYRKAAIKSKLSLSALNSGQSLIISIGLILSMLLAGYEIQNHELTVGDFVALNTYLIQLYIPLHLLGFAYREVKIALINLENMFELVDEPLEITDKPNAPSLLFKGGEIIFDKVSFSYTPDRPILKEVSFTVPAGKTLAIVGVSGAGKSTISRLLFRFYDVSSGKILIDDQDIRDITQKSLRQNIGIVPQDTVLFNETIGYNIAYGRPTCTESDIIDVSKSAQIHDFIERLPEGYATRVGERGLKLSGGEKQRVAIARTLLKNPKIFLFDEATSALDTRTEKQIQENLAQVSKNHTTIIIAHRLSTVISADQIIVLDEGRIAEQGNHHDLLKLGGLYATMWQRQNTKHS